MKLNRKMIYLSLIVSVVLGVAVGVNYFDLEKEEETNIEKEENRAEENGVIIYEYEINEKEKIAVFAGEVAMGKVAIQICKTTDGGSTYNVITENNEGYMWVSRDAEYIFVNENLGYISSPRNGGDEAVLFVTRNGGKNFETLTFENQTLGSKNKLYEGLNWENVYDYYELPIIDGNTIIAYVSQGADGDYEGGNTAAKYVSKDLGETFEFEKEEHNHM